MKKMTIGLVLLLSTNALLADFCSKNDCAGLANSIIEYDSKRWFINRYDSGSTIMNNVIFDNGTKVKYKVNYTYNNGMSGWAIIEAYEGEFQCIRYHDFPSECRSSRKW